MVHTRRSVAAEKAEEDQDTVQNPMLNNPVLKTFFAVIPFRAKDFKNFRLVSKQWFQESRTRWRRNAWLIIRDSRFLDTHTGLHIKSCLEMIAVPGDPFGLLGVSHFRKYSVRLVQNMTFTEHFYLGKGRLQFWTTLGPLMHHLKLAESKIFSKEEAQRVLLEMTPNLEFLSYENNRIFEDSQVPLPLTNIEWRGVTTPVWNEMWSPRAATVQNNLTCLAVSLRWEFPTAWVYYLARFPNIQVLKLKDFMNRYRLGSLNEELDLFFKSIQCIRERCNPEAFRNLRVLDLLNASIKCIRTFPTALLPVLRDLAFPVAELTLDIGIERGEDILKYVLRLYSKTLQKLSVFRGPYSAPLQGTFPYGQNLPFLTELKLVGPICSNLHFLMNTPKLNVLVILDGTREIEHRLLHSYIEIGLPGFKDKLFRNQTPTPPHPVISGTNFEGSELENVVLPNLDELIVGNELCSGETVERLGKLFPNLRKLRLGLDNKGFSKVCHIWKRLEYLDVQPFDVNEEGLLGSRDGQMYRQPNLTDFKYLTSLRMGHHSSSPEEAKLSNNSILCGLLVTHSLKEVSISVFPQDYLKIRAKLFDKFPQS